MAVLFRDRLALAKTELLEAACEDKARMSSIHVRPLHALLRGFIDSVTPQDRVKLSHEILQVAFAPKDLDLLFSTVFPAPGPDNKKKNGNRSWAMVDYRRFVAFFLDVSVERPSRRQRINGFQADDHSLQAHRSWLSETI